MARIPIPSPDDLTPEQRRVYDAIAASPRGGVHGPFLALLHSPELADRVQELGQFVRFQTRLGAKLTELAILATARSWTCQFEWLIHARNARNAGLAHATIDAIKAGCRPDFEDEEQGAVHDYALELLATRSVSDATYQAALDAFGAAGIVELTAIVGYYSLLAMTLNAHQLPLPEGAEPPLKPLPVRHARPPGSARHQR